LLRVAQLGLSIDDTKQLTFGMVMDMLIESGNDQIKYDTKASQEDFNKF